MSSTQARELTTSNRRGTMLTRDVVSAQVRTTCRNVAVPRLGEGDDDAVTRSRATTRFRS